MPRPRRRLAVFSNRRVAAAGGRRRLSGVVRVADVRNPPKADRGTRRCWNGRCRTRLRLMTAISSTIPPDGLIGRLDIPRLNISAPVEAGEDAGVLDFAVGYLPDTPLPWKPGNSAFAAHRDRLFRPLERIRVGDDIRLSTIHGDFQYKVSRTLIVNPEDLWVLDPSPDADLTLITCFPFRVRRERRQSGSSSRLARSSLRSSPARTSRASVIGSFECACSTAAFTHRLSRRVLAHRLPHAPFIADACLAPSLHVSAPCETT